VLTVRTLDEEACPGVSPLIFGAVLMTQATSIRKLSFNVDSTAFTGPDTAILVRSCSSRSWLQQATCGATIFNCLVELRSSTA